jgi:cytochrome P450
MTTFDIDDASHHLDPYPTYAQLRQESPVFFYPDFGFWMVLRYEDVANCVRNPAVFSHEQFWMEPVSKHDASNEDQKYVIDSFSHMFMYADGARHSRMRRQSNQRFGPREVKAQRANVERICRQLLEDCREKGSVDFVHNFALLLPSLVVADYLGIPTQDRDEIRHLVDLFSVIFEPLLPDDARHTMLVDAGKPLADYLDGLIEKRRKNPGDDFISMIASVSENGGGMTVDELRGNLMHLLIAGNETTTNLLGHLMVVLSRHPQVRHRIASDHQLVAPCVEETLRWEAPIQLIIRHPVEDVQIAGQDIPKGALIGLVIASANHDEQRFPGPDVWDIDRPNSKEHLSFANGPHFCIGAPLARLEGAVAVEMLTTEFRDLVVENETEATWKPDNLLRGYNYLPVKASQSAPA